jgi:hypothetical protein
MIEYLIKVKTIILFLFILLFALLNSFIFNYLEVDFGENSLEEMPKTVLFLLVVFLAPFYETLFFNLLPIKVFQYFFKNNLLIIFFSSFVFSLIHNYSYPYMLMTYIGGILVNTFFIITEKKHSVLKSLLLTIALHSLYNLIGFLLIEVFKII